VRAGRGRGTVLLSLGAYGMPSPSVGSAMPPRSESGERLGGASSGERWTGAVTLCMSARRGRKSRAPSCEPARAMARAEVDADMGAARWQWEPEE